ncbi:hypothetical protein [Pseudomonas mosselii]|uniref:hypothetical protein n=1 Tax=Pseudomonas mosselii TaxID=78327 RepID=UPI0016450C0C|nr:hypothetical protein [Pseudomonas mosselii]MBC3456987.1 hypothetical protein [Pseudomonas mosselii]
MTMSDRLCADNFNEHLPELFVTAPFRKSGAAPEGIGRKKVRKKLIDLAGIKVRAMPVVFFNDSQRDRIFNSH